MQRGCTSTTLPPSSRSNPRHAGQPTFIDDGVDFPSMAGLVSSDTGDSGW